MEPQMQNQPSAMNTTPLNEEPKSVGPAIGIIVIIVIIVIGALYFWGQRVDNSATNEVQVTNEQPVNNDESLGTSDELADIEADLSATTIEGLGSEVSDAESAAQ